MMKWVKSLFKHRHKWETTHVNRYQHPTGQICPCGVRRELRTEGLGLCRWLYSDGEVSEIMEWGEQ